MKVLMIGDVVGSPGRRILKEQLPRIKRELGVAAVIVNAENAAAGSGITVALANEIFAAGADAITLGDHTWGQKEFAPTIGQLANTVRPANYPPGAPGKGWTLVTTPICRFAVLNLLGRVFMNPMDCPFRTADAALNEMPKDVPVFVDFHAEATSEKITLAHYLDGRVTAVAAEVPHGHTRPLLRGRGPCHARGRRDYLRPVNEKGVRHRGVPLQGATRMIAYVKGTLAEKSPSRVIVDVGGVGYEAFIPLSTFDRLPAAGEAVKLHTYHCVREDAQTLYGFATEREREMFELVTTVSGVGPKIALAVLSGLTIGDLQLAIAEGNAKRLASVKGIGKKTAERIVIDLKDKVNPIEAVANATAASADDAKAGMVRDALLALTALGFNEDTARKQVQKVLADDPAVSDTETIIRRALSGK